jgi:hypothetical protein
VGFYKFVYNTFWYHSDLQLVTYLAGLYDILLQEDLLMNLIDIFEEPSNEELIIKWKENNTEYSLVKGMFGDISIEPHTSMYSTDYIDLLDLVFLLFCRTTIVDLNYYSIDQVIEYLNEAYNTISVERKKQVINNIRKFRPDYKFKK